MHDNSHPSLRGATKNATFVVGFSLKNLPNASAYLFAAMENNARFTQSALKKSVQGKSHKN